MRRAYPQFMAGRRGSAAGRRPAHHLPARLLAAHHQVLDEHKLDPYLIAALMAQESTFTAEIRSHANAYGLMQIIPDTGRATRGRWASSRSARPCCARPEINVRIGTQYFRDLIDKYGGAHFALASYNAGESRVDRWTDERPGLPQDEFIDDIPFPETQTYVKRILGTAEDYRYLYGGGLLDPNQGQALVAVNHAPAATVAPAAASKSATKATPAKKPAKKPARRSRR
jgi:soluble lytic murein transglycosylase